MPGYLRRLQRLTRSERREEVERALRDALQRLDDQRTVAAALSRMGADGFVVAHYTFDEPELEAAGAAVQFTYHLCDRLAGPGEPQRDEVRGSGIAVLDDEGRMHFEDVDAELYRLVDDVVDGSPDA
jgi:hypothetical protein